MTDWVPDERNAKTFGPFIVTPLRPRSGTEGAHHVDFGDGRGLLVLPTPAYSTRKRFGVLQGVLDDLNAIRANFGPIGANEALDPRRYVIGHLSELGIPWESVGSLREPTFGEWLDRYLKEHGGFRVLPAHFLAALDADGWEIRRKEADS